MTKLGKMPLAFTLSFFQSFRPKRTAKKAPSKRTITRTSRTHVSGSFFQSGLTPFTLQKLSSYIWKQQYASDSTIRHQNLIKKRKKQKRCHARTESSICFSHIVRNERKYLKFTKVPVQGIHRGVSYLFTSLSSRNLQLLTYFLTTFA